MPLTIGIMNPTDAEVELRPSITGATPNGDRTRWHVTGASPTVHNTPGERRVVDIQRTGGIPVTGSLRVSPLSCAVFSLPLK